MSESHAAGRKTDEEILDDAPTGAELEDALTAEAIKGATTSELKQMMLARIERAEAYNNEQLRLAQMSPRDRMREKMEQFEAKTPQTPEPAEGNAMPLPPAKVELPQEVYRPGSTEAFLNAQLLECVALVRDMGDLYRNSPLKPYDRTDFVDHAIRVMEASTKVSDAIRRLSGGEDAPPTTRHLCIVEHRHVGAQGEGGGGRAVLENE